MLQNPKSKVLSPVFNTVNTEPPAPSFQPPDGGRTATVEQARRTFLEVSQTGSLVPCSGFRLRGIAFAGKKRGPLFARTPDVCTSSLCSAIWATGSRRVSVFQT